MYEKLLKELREIMARLTEYRALDSEARTEEKRTQKKADLERSRVLELEIADEEEMIAIEERNNRSINGKPPEGGLDTSHSLEIADAPIYRSAFPLGEQMRDIIDQAHSQEARGRLNQVYNRAKELAEKRAAGTGGMIEGVSTEGGFLLQGETAIELITNGFNNSEVLKRCAKRTTSMQSVEIVGIDETSRANGSRGGGVRVYTDKELGAMTPSKTKFSTIELKPHKLTGLYYASSEILQDAPMLEGEMTALFDQEFNFKTQDLVFRGLGAGEALGILASPATVSQAKETGQIAKTIVTDNILKMESRLASTSTAGLAWFVNRECKTQLPKLAIEIGTGGQLVPLYQPPGSLGNELASLNGIPLIPVEQCSALGTVGDIILADMSQYICVDKGGIDAASSMHLKFDYNQTTFRYVYRFDGQPRWKSAITPYKGTATVSPFITLATRA